MPIARIENAIGQGLTLVFLFRAGDISKEGINPLLIIFVVTVPSMAVQINIKRRI
jgi:hypothetical protein